MDVGVSADNIPASACAIVVTNADAVATCFIGLAIHGDKGTLKDIERKALAVGLKARRVDTNAPPLETMIFFKPPLARVDVMRFYHAVLLMQEPGLKIELIVSPAAKAADGIDLEDEVQIVMPAYIREPAS